MNCMTRSSLNQLPLICLLLSGEMSQWTTFNKTQPFHYPVSQTSHCHCLSSTSISKREIVTVDSSRGWVRENELWEIVRCFFFVFTVQLSKFFWHCLLCHLEDKAQPSHRHPPTEPSGEHDDYCAINLIIINPFTDPSIMGLRCPLNLQIKYFHTTKVQCDRLEKSSPDLVTMCW